MGNLYHAPDVVNDVAVNQDFAMLYDSSYCMGCKACQVACKQTNMLPAPMKDEEYEFNLGGYTYPPENSGDNYLRMVFTEVDNPNGPKPFDWIIRRESCNHCTRAGCVEACPTGACHYVGNGSVDIDPHLCIGCKFCSTGCPWSVPKYRERDNINAKCWFCQDRLSQDEEPACVKTCFPDALDWGYRSTMLTKAQKRVEQLKSGGYEDACIYGEHEMEGLHLLQVLKYKPEVYGLNPNPSIPLMKTIGEAMTPVALAGVLGTLAFVSMSYKNNKNYKKPKLHYDPKTDETYTQDGEIWFKDEFKRKHSIEPGDEHKEQKLVEKGSDQTVVKTQAKSDEEVK